MFKSLLRVFGIGLHERSPAPSVVPAVPIPEDPIPTQLPTRQLGIGVWGQEIVGESFYQEQVARTITESGGRRFTVAIVAETDNPHDQQAVAILSESGAVLGHLPRPVNALWWEEIGAIREGGECPVCEAEVIGGTVEKEYYGLLLDLPPRRSATRPRPPVDRVFEDDDFEFEWSYGGETVTLDQSMWAHREPDTDTPLSLNRRRHTELSPRHVMKLLKAYDAAKSKMRSRNNLFRAVEAAAASCNEGAQSTVLALLLTQQYRDQCHVPDSYESAAVGVMRSKLLERAGRLEEAAAVVREALTWATWPHGVTQLHKRLKAIDRKLVPRPTRVKKTKESQAPQQ